MNSALSRLGETPLLKLWALMSPALHRRGWWLLLLTFGGMGMEVFSLALLIPAMGILLDPAFPQNHVWLASVLALLGCQTQSQRMIAGMAIFLAAYGAKSVYLAYLYWRQNRFVFDFQADLGRRLFQGYLSMPWAFHLQRNSSELIRNVVVETSNLAYLLLQAVQVLAEIFILVGVGALLFWAQPWGCLLMISAVGAGSWCFQAYFKSRSLRWGEQRKKEEDARILHLTQGLGGFKEIRISGRQDAFLEKFQIHNQTVAWLNARNGFLQMMPRLALEFLILAGLALFVVMMLLQGGSPRDLFLSLGLFAAATIRIMPSATRILTAVQNGRFYLPVLETVRRELSAFPVSRTEVDRCRTPFLFRKEISVDHISFRYPGKENWVLADVSLRIPFGTSLAITGPNGTGKSTLLDLLLGLLEPQQGKILVDDRDIRDDLVAWQQGIGYVPQAVYLMDDSLEANIAFGEERIDSARMREAVRLVGMENWIEGLPQGLKTRIGERGVGLSGGQRQKVGIARALYRNPSLLVLDEPTSALDKDAESLLHDFVKKTTGIMTVLLVTHSPVFQFTTTQNINLSLINH